MRAEPGNTDHTAVDREVERRENKADQPLGLHKELVDIFGGNLEFSDFIRLAHKTLDHANTGHILLHARIQRVVFRKHARKRLSRKFDDQDQYNEKKAERYQKNHRELPADAEGERKRKNQRGRRPHAGPEYHLVRVLDIRDIRRETGHKARSRVLVEIAERKALDASVNSAAKTCCQSRRRIRREVAADRAENQTENRKSHHHAAALKNHGKILSLDTVVNEICHDERDQIFNDDFHDHAENSKQGNPAVFFPEICAEHFNHMFPPQVKVQVPPSPKNRLPAPPPKATHRSRGDRSP